MFGPKFRTTVANLVLIGSTVWAMGEFLFPRASFINAAMLIHLILGAAGISSLLLDSMQSHEPLEIATTFVFPCVATQIFLTNGFHELAFIPLGAAIVLYVKDLYHGRPMSITNLSDDPRGWVMLCTCVAVVLWGFLAWNLFVIGMALWFALYFFAFENVQRVIKLPPEDLALYCLAVLNMWAVFVFKPPVLTPFE